MESRPTVSLRAVDTVVCLKNMSFQCMSISWPQYSHFKREWSCSRFIFMYRDGIRTENQHFSKWRKAVVGAGPGTPSCGLFKPPTEGPDGLMASLLRTQCAQLYMYMTATNYCNVELYIAWTVSHYWKADLCLWKNWNTAPLNPTGMTEYVGTYCK